MEIQDRIKMVMKMHNMNASQFADNIDVQRSSISHILSGRNKPSLDFIQKLLAKFPRVNAEWLISGKAKDRTSDNLFENQTTNSEKILQKEEEKRTNTLRLPDKKIAKIILLYEDGSFDAHHANLQ